MNIKLLAKMYEEYLSNTDFDVTLPSQPNICDAYNEYDYQQIIKEQERLYFYCDSLDITERFLKGD